MAICIKKEAERDCFGLKEMNSQREHVQTGDLGGVSGGGYDLINIYSCMKFLNNKIKNKYNHSLIRFS